MRTSPEDLVIWTPNQCAEFEEVLLRTYYRSNDQEFLFTDESARRGFAEHLEKRMLMFCDVYLPWVASVVPLSEMDVIEVGCGTGSSTAVFARACKSVTAMEIEGSSIEVARERLRILGIHNAKVESVEAKELVRRLEASFRDVGLILLFAVLEHATPDERVSLLTAIGKALRPGGFVVIADTPNRLAYFDNHSSYLPFFHMLPPELAVEYAQYSPRANFRKLIAQQRSVSKEKGVEITIRSGLGVSYHEFEIALGLDVHDWVVADGSEPSLRRYFPVREEERILTKYFTYRELNKSHAFARLNLNMILRKPTVL